MIFGFATYESKSICDKGTVVETKSINKNVNETVNIVVKENVSALVEKGSKIETDQEIIYETELSAPLKAGDEVGKIKILNKEDGNQIGETSLVLEKDIARSSITDYFKKIFKMYLLADVV